MKLNEGILVDVLAYLKGEAKDEQTERIRLWLAENDENKKSYRETVDAYYLSNYAQNWDQINVFKAKRDIDAKLIRKKKSPYWSVAASIVLIVGLSMSLFFIDFKPETELAQISQIEPGQKGAELILSNGQTLQVMNTQKLLKEQNGSLVEIDSLKGLVYDNSRSTGNKLIYNTIKVARGQEFNLQLADGTKVWLNAESELRYPVQFTTDNRKVFLKGEAYFEVAHNKDKAFVVNSFDQDLKVYGTKFNINAYDKNLIKTVLVEGSVGVKINRLNKEKKMIPGDLLLANTIDGHLSSKQVDVYPYIAWKDGSFLFQDESLEDIMLRLERWYDVKVFYNDNRVRKELFVGNMKRYTDIDKLLYFMEKSSDARFEIKDDVIIVSSK
jgi:ferric-dicitrate binding protein FerR (iron transport regulator)